MSESMLVRDILKDYPPEFQRSVLIDGVGPIGDHMPYVGSIPRFFKSKEPNYYDQVVHDYIIQRGEDPKSYMDYAVVPKRLNDSYRSVKRYDRDPDPLSDVTKAQYDVAFSWLSMEMSPSLGGSRVMSYDEVVEWLRPMKSPGLPWTQLYPFKCDYWMSPHSDFYAKYWDVLSTPDYIRSLCSVSIKEEVRPVCKIEIGNVRTIVAMDTNHVQAHLQLYLHQNQRLVATCGQHSMCLGQNLLNGQADKLVGSMSLFGPKSVLEVDGDKFDSRKKRYQLEKVEEFRFGLLAKEFQTAANRVRSKNLYEELISAPVVLPNGHVFGRASGNPSGQGCTTPDNCFLNYTDWAVLFQKLVPVEFHTYECWKAFIKLIICGDDINVAAAECVREYITPARIRAVAPEIGMVYTFGSEEYRDAVECPFLGHSFKEVAIPGLPHTMVLPVITCERMRSNMLVDNAAQTLEMTIIRACGLRNETFACESCREWFQSLIDYLRDLSSKSVSPEITLAWKSWLPDLSLWKLYTGRTCGSEVVDRAEEVRVEAPPDHVEREYGDYYDIEDEYDEYGYYPEERMCQARMCSLQPVACEKAALEKHKFKLSTPLSFSQLSQDSSISHLLFNNRCSQPISVSNMARTAAQRAARNLRRKTRNAKGPRATKQGGKTQKGHFVQPAKGRKKRSRKQGSSPVGPNSMSKRGMPGSGPSPYAGRTATTSTSKRSQVIEENEYIADVMGSVSLSVVPFAVNPGQAATFAWGSQIASLYERYHFDFVEFYYTASVSGFATQGQAGAVVLSADYDAADAPPTSIRQIEDTDPHTVPALPSTSVIALKLDPKSMGSSDSKYVRPGAQPANTDIKTYDAANVFLSVSGCANTSKIGELHVRYRCNLMKPVLESVVPISGAIHFASAAPTSGSNLAAMVLQAGGSPALAGITASGNTVTFPASLPGTYFLSFSGTSASSWAAIAHSSSTGGVSSLSLFSNDSAVSAVSLAATTGAYVMLNTVIAVTAAGGSWVLTPGAIVGPLSMDLFIMSLPSTMLTVDETEQVEIDDLRARAKAQDARLARLENMLSSLSLTSEEQKSDSPVLVPSTSLRRAFHF
jgi:hypothetical protein